MRHEQERTGFQYQEPERLTGAAEQQQAASGITSHRQGVLNKTEARNTRRYYEGLVKLATLKALYHNLVAPSWQRAVQKLSIAFNSDHEAKAQTVATEPANRVKSSAEITLIEKGWKRARAECHAHHAKAEAFGLLGDRYRELGSDRLAHDYHERARLESASARGFDNVIKAYDKKLEDLGNTRLTKQESPNFRSSFRSLEQADRYLEDYNSGYARVRNHTRRVLANERTIQRLEAACASRPQASVEHQLLKEAVDRGEKLKSLAETEAFNAVASYRNFQKEIESAEKAYDVLSRILTGNPAELTSSSPQRETSGNKDRSQTQLESHRDLDPPCPVGETSISNKSIEEPELDKPELQGSGLDLNHLKPSGSRPSRAVVAAVITQTLKEMDREL